MQTIIKPIATLKKSLLTSVTQMRLSRKLPLIITGLALISGGAVGYYSLQSLASNSRNAAANQMSAKLQSKQVAFDALT